MTIRFATDDEINRWDDLVVHNSDRGNMLQGSVFLNLKRLANWRPRFIICGELAIGAIEKHIPLFGKVWYIPKGPGVASASELASVVPILRDFARQQGVFTIKIEPELLRGTDISAIELLPTRPIQYNASTVVVDLHSDLDTILKDLPQKGRHAIRRADRDGVVVKQVSVNDETCQAMYDLFKETADGAGFTIRSPQYYREFYQRYADAGQGQLFFAYYQDQLVAGAFAVILGTKSTYKDGASVRKRTAYGASHRLQWEVIKWAKEHGSLEHDLCGTPASDEMSNPNHPRYGLGRFKTSFNKHITDYIGAFEIPVSPIKSRLWSKYIERLVRRLYFMRHHESYY
jgi:methicillin resistance protein